VTFAANRVRAVGVLLLAAFLLAALAVAQEPEWRLAEWTSDEREFFLDGPQFLLAPAELERVRSLDPLSRLEYIDTFLDRGRVAEAVEHRRQRVRMAGLPFFDVRARLLFLHGEPDAIDPVDCDQTFRPLQLWRYGPEDGEHTNLVIYQPKPAEVFRLWLPEDTKRALYMPEMEYFLEQYEELRGLLRARRFDLQVCEKARRVDEITGIRGLFGFRRDRRSDEDFLENVLAYLSRNTRRLRFSDHVKMFADGGFFAELMMLEPPGHLDGRRGEWVTPPERFEEIARVLWYAGLKIHVHCSGDRGVELALSTLEKLQWERPRFDHRFTFEHFGISSSQQVDRMAAMGAVASVNAYYVYELSEAFAANTVGYERASQISRLGSLERARVRFAVHSDFPMAPAKPLNNAWVAANRLAASGAVMCRNERASLDAAIKAITTNAAYVLGLEEEIGSLRWGKQADFTILEADPYEVGIESLRDIPIWGTVFEGEKFEG